MVVGDMIEDNSVSGTGTRSVARSEPDKDTGKSARIILINVCLIAVKPRGVSRWWLVIDMELL